MNSGPVLAREYSENLNSDGFRIAQEYSDSFVSRNRKLLMNYKWSKDPLHQWSRQWEYPFVMSKLAEYVASVPKKDTGMKILDCGSGFTFFPFLLSDSFEPFKIECIDIDDSLGRLFDLTTNSRGEHLSFKCADLHTLPYESESVDVIFSISVIEHTDNYESILREFHRVLKHGGTLILTFDISLDGQSDIPITKARSLLMDLRDIFKDPIRFEEELTPLVDHPEEYLTTRWVMENSDKRLLPYRRDFVSQVKSLIKFGKLDGHFSNLTVFTCSSSKG